MTKAAISMNRFSGSLLPYTRTIGGGSREDCSAGWIAGRSILAYGVRVGIRTNKPEFLDRILDHAPPLWKPTSVQFVERLFSLHVGGAGLRRNGRSAYRLLDDLDTAAESRSLKEILKVFEVRLKMYVAEMARRRVFVHAGAVGWQGKAIVVPGHSMCGKTSLVAELVRAGATYYSDEYAVLDSQGRVHPYPQSLAMRKPGSPKQKNRSVEEIGGVNGTKPLPVGLVVVSRHESGARWRPEELSGGQGVLELLANTVPARRKPEVVIPILRKVVMGATILKGVRGEAKETARHILQGGFWENRSAVEGSARE
ncbi:MAG: hypothetical protein WAU45_02720 [Blastocatellia bacterium]